MSEHGELGGLERLWAGWRAAYVETAAQSAEGSDECLLCALAAADPSEALVLARDDRVFAVMNAYPYTSGHLMVAPVRHVADLELLDDAESHALMVTTQRAVRAIKAAYRPHGLNVGANLGRAAGAGVPGHVHLHVVPRWDADTNFMTAIAEARVLPEALPVSWERLQAAWPD